MTNEKWVIRLHNQWISDGHTTFSADTIDKARRFWTADAAREYLRTCNDVWREGAKIERYVPTDPPTAAETPESKASFRALLLGLDKTVIADKTTWRGSKTDFVHDLLHNIADAMDSIVAGKVEKEPLCQRSTWCRWPAGHEGECSAMAQHTTEAKGCITKEALDEAYLRQAPSETKAAPDVEAMLREVATVWDDDPNDPNSPLIVRIAAALRAERERYKDLARYIGDSVGNHQAHMVARRHLRAILAWGWPEGTTGPACVRDARAFLGGDGQVPRHDDVREIELLRKDLAEKGAALVRMQERYEQASREKEAYKVEAEHARGELVSARAATEVAVRAMHAEYKAHARGRAERDALQLALAETERERDAAVARADEQGRALETAARELLRLVPSKGGA